MYILLSVPITFKSVTHTFLSLTYCPFPVLWPFPSCHISNWTVEEKLASAAEKNMKRWIRGTILWRWWCRESFAQRLLFARKHLIMAGTDAPPRWDLGPPYIKAEDLLSWNLFPLLLFAELQCQTFLIAHQSENTERQKERKTKDPLIKMICWFKMNVWKPVLQLY